MVTLGTLQVFNSHMGAGDYHGTGHGTDTTFPAWQEVLLDSFTTLKRKQPVRNEKVNMHKAQGTLPVS